jgi:hypothetical protein
MQLSRNLAYMIAQHTPKFGKEDCTFKKFKTAGEASFEYHWNNHEHCGKWCKTTMWTEKEKIQNKSKFRDKIKNKKEYKQQITKVKKKYLSTPRLRRCYHQLCNNKTEQLNGLVMFSSKTIALLPQHLWQGQNVHSHECGYPLLQRVLPRNVRITRDLHVKHHCQVQPSA